MYKDKADQISDTKFNLSNGFNKSQVSMSDSEGLILPKSEYGFSTGGANCKTVHLHGLNEKKGSQILLRDMKSNT